MDEVRARIEKGFALMADDCFSKLVTACDRLDRRIGRATHRLRTCTHQLCERVDHDLNVASRVVQKEVKNKLMLTQWCTHFIAESKYEEMSPVIFAYARFSLNISACYNEVTYESLIKSNVHTFLVSLLDYEQDVVVGPALLALTHISLINDPIKHDIVHVGALPKLLSIMATRKSKPLLTHAAKLCASLALHLPNKPLIAVSGLFHALLDLTTGTHVEVSTVIQIYALHALLNLVDGSDANRCILVDLNGLAPLLRCVLYYSHPDIIMYSVQVLANVAYRSTIATGALLRNAADSAIVEVLNYTDIIDSPEMTYSCLLALTNCCTSARYRSHIASDAVKPVLRVCEWATDLRVVNQAALLVGALVFDNVSNKALFPGKGALGVLVGRLLLCCDLPDEDISVSCVRSLSLALSSILLFQPNHELFYDVDGLARVADRCRTLTSASMLQALSMLLSTLVPCPTELYRFRVDEFVHPSEQLRVLDVLRRIKYSGYGKAASLPAWFEAPIKYLQMSDADLAKEPPWLKHEFVEFHVFFDELRVQVYPDLDLSSFAREKGMLFTIY